MEKEPIISNNNEEGKVEDKWERYNRMKKEGTWIGPPPREKTGYIPEDEFSFKGSEDEESEDKENKKEE